MIVTRADQDVIETARITHPIIRKYAEKCEAEFLILQGPEKHPYSHFRILRCYELLDRFDRILSLDTDILISDDCPDLFKIVPKSKIGTILEDKGSRQKHRRDVMEQAQKRYGDIGWREGYTNSGVFLASRKHKDIFKWDRDLWVGPNLFGEDDVILGYRIRELGFKIFELPFQFNHMSLFSEEWNGSPSRFDSHIIHYAGRGFWPFLSRLDQIRQDYELLYNRWWSTNKKIKKDKVKSSNS